MEKRKGHNKTNNTLIPEEWNSVILGDYMELLHGHQFRNKDFTETGIPVIKIGQISPSGKLDLSGLTYISLDRLEEFQDKIITNGDVLMSLTGNIGRVVVVRNQERICVQNYRVGKFIPKDTKSLDKSFMSVILASPQVFIQLERNSNKTAQMNFGKQDMDKIKFLLPPLPEQQKIAEILTTVDDKISSIEDRIQQTEQLKKGLMEKLLTGGIGHTEFKDTKIGRIPASWELLKSIECFNLKHGHQFRDYDYVENGLPIIKIGQIKHNGTIDLSNCSYFSESRNKEFEKNVINNGDVLMALTGATLGKTCIVKGLSAKAYQNYRVGKFEPIGFDRVNKIFLFYLLKSKYVIRQIFNKVNEGAQGNIGKSDFNKLFVAIPSLTEQKQIATILSTLDDKLAVLQSKKTSYEALKKGLMEQLLTGEKRVKL